MGLFDDKIDGGLERMFDFDRDGKLDRNERILLMDYIDEEFSEDSDYDDEDDDLDFDDCDF